MFEKYEERYLMFSRTGFLTQKEIRHFVRVLFSKRAIKLLDV